MVDKNVGLIGARSFVGARVVSLLRQKGHNVIPFSRRGGNGMVPLDLTMKPNVDQIPYWISVAPVWTVPEHFQLLQKYGIQRLVALSSTSRFTKIASSSSAERRIASWLKSGEEEVLAWAGSNDVDVVILQTTLIYGHGLDRNITQIADVIRRFGFFPILGKGNGLRQPVHVDDVAAACVSALESKGLKHLSYILSGGEVLSYREMIVRIYSALGKRPRFLRCPLIIFKVTVKVASLFSWGSLKTEMAVRMNMDQNFDHSNAANDLGFRPRPFFPQRTDCIRN